MSKEGSLNTQGTIAVTGASRGIGAAIAGELASRGFTVACLNRSGQPPAATALQPESRARLVGITCDVTKEADIKPALKAASALGPPLVGVVNNAGIMQGGRSSDISTDEFAAVLQTNLLGPFAVCQAAFPYLQAHGSSLIVNIGSFWGQMGIKRYAAYCASKAAVAALTRCLGVEWAKQGIRVLDVAPGYIETDINADEMKEEEVQKFLESRLPAGRIGKPEEVARLVAALFCENIEYLNATTIYIDGGQGPAL